MSRAATARRMEVEAEERFDPLNRLLDAFETLVEDLVDRGMEAPMRARLDRLLPARRPRHSRDREIELTNLLSYLRDQAGRRHTAAEHARWQHFAEFVKGELAEMREAA